MSNGLHLHSMQAEVHNDNHRFKVVCAGRRWGKCLKKGTLIAMADGTYKKIEEVKEGDLVLTMNEDTYKIEIRKVQHLHDNGIKETLTVKTKSGKELPITPNHPLLQNNIWTEGKDLTIGELIAIPRVTIFGNTPMLRHEVDFLAVWLAEGGYNGYTNKTPEIIEVMQNVANSVNCEFVSGSLDQKRKELEWRWRGKELRTNNLISILKKFGLRGKNSKTKSIPDEIFRLPKDQLARFLNLFVACDGSINLRSKKTWAMEIGLANEVMVRQIADLFLKFGIRGNISKKIHKAKSSVTGENFISWRFIVSDSKSLITFCNEIGALSKEDKVKSALNSAMNSRGSSNSYLPISHDEFVKRLKYSPEKKGNGGYNFKVSRDLPNELRLSLNSWRKQTSSRISERRFEAISKYSDGYFDPILDEDIAWDEIAEIEQSGDAQTYDLTIEGNHNFIANGIITHNTVAAKAALIKFASIPNQYVWYVAPTYRMSKQIMWSEIIDSLPSSWIKRTNETVMRIELINGSVIELKGADKPDALRGVGLNFIVLDEFQDMKPNVWKTVLRPTLATTKGHAFFIGTPKGYSNILYEVWLMGQPGPKKSPQWKSWQFPTISSPFVPEEEIENARRDMDEKSFKQEFEANFENMSGRVYYNFDRKTNVTSKAEFNPKLPICIGQDFNIDPMSSAVCQIQPDGQIWVVDEIVLLNSNTEEACEEIERRYWRYINQIIIYPDPAGGARQHARGETDLDIFREKGYKRIKYRRKHPAVSDRVNAVNKIIRSASGEIKLLVNPKCRNTIESLEKVVYKEGGREIDKSAGIEHITDALGYFIEIEFPLRKTEIAGISI